MAENEQTMAEASDEALFSRIAQGDATAFAAFYDRHETLWYSLAFRIVQNPAEAEDVLQEAAVLIWEKAPQYDSRLGRPVSWAVTLVRNKAIDRVRASRRRGAVVDRSLDDSVEVGSTSDEPSAAAGRGDAAQLVRTSLATLPTDQRQAIELAFFSGFSQSEIADRLRQPLGTVKARIRRGMLAMRDALEGAL